MLVNDASCIRTAQIVLTLMFCTMRPQVSLAAPSGDACLLFAASEVGAILGVSVSEGQHPIASTLLLCDWPPVAQSQTEVKKLSVNLMTERAFDVGKTPMPRITKTPLSGVGDDAYYVTAGGLGTALSVKKGGMYVQIRVSGFSIDRAKELEKTLALQMLAKL